MLTRKGVLVLLGAAALGAVLLLQGPVLRFFGGVNGSTASGNYSPKSNPRYQNYDFGPPGGSVINVGYQPLAIPTGTVAAVMLHDRVLAKQLETYEKKLRFHPFLEGGDVNAFLFAGHLQLMWAGDLPVITAAAKAEVIVTAQTKTSFASVVARNLLSMDQLKGRRIGYAPGSSAHQTLLHGMALHNLSEKDVKLVSMAINQMIPAIQKGTIDAFAAWEPTPTLAMEKIKDLTVPYRNLTQSYLYFSKGFADVHPELTKIGTAANVRAVRWMSKDSANSLKACQWQIELVAEFSKDVPPTTTNQCQSILRRDLLDPLPMATIAPESLRENGIVVRQISFLRQINILNSDTDPVKILKSFKPDILQEILHDKDKWKINEFDYQQHPTFP